MACATTTRPAFSFHFSQLSLPKPKTHFSRLPFISIYNPKKTVLTLHHSIDVSKEDIPQPPTASSTQESPPPPPPQSIQEDEIQSQFQGDELQFDQRRLEEKFAVLNTGIYECRSCGFKYDEAVGDPSYPIPPGLVFDKLPEDWRCSTCGAAKSFFEILVCDDEADFQQYGADSGCVEARTSCDHLASLSSDLTHIPTPDTSCNKCQDPSENWLCLCCKEVLCSRFVNKHMLQHYQQRNHCLALSYSDLSVWCFECDSYLDAQVMLQLRGVYETAYILKYGEAPPFRTPVEPPSSSLDHQARDCSSGS